MDGQEYTELFVVRYTGSVKSLRDQLEEFDSIEHFSLSRPGFRLAPQMELEEETDLDCNIGYNTHRTDRTQLAQQIEEFEGVSEVILA